MRAAPTLAVVAVLGFAVLATGSVGHGPAIGSRLAPMTTGMSAQPLRVNVSWDGLWVANASSAASAFSIDPGESAQVRFAFTGAPDSSAVTATLVLGLAGFALSHTSTLDTASRSGAGHTEINWTFGSLYVAIEGVYPLTAELFAANGSLLFSQQFFIDAHAPDGIGSATVIFLAVLGVVEVGWIVGAIRRVRRRRRRLG